MSPFGGSDRRKDSRAAELPAPVLAASRMLGARLSANGVVVRIVEVEAYGSEKEGPWPDPAAHSYRGRTPRNSIMFDEPGRLYVYLSYGMHYCLNVTCGQDGSAAAVLLRAGEVLEGQDVAAARRPSAKRVPDLARGPGNLGAALGITLSDYGVRLFDPDAPVRLELGESSTWSSGPRVGVSSAADRQWRLWLPDSSAVSAYRRSPRAPVSGDAGRSSGD